jgi:5-methylcytosine-specific restriction endonuclease McrA
MPWNMMTLSRVDMPVSLAEGLKILERDQFCCRYCGLDGRASFDNALVMSVDFVVPRARHGKKDPANLVACCRPCNMIKGTRVYKSIDDAKKYVLARREEMRQAWESKRSRPAARAASA